MSTPTPETIDLTPTWAETAHMLLAILDGGTPKGKEMARQEVRRMGALLDHHAKVREKLAEYLKAQETDEGAEDHWLLREGLRELLRT